jgi:hypothetical protein
VAYRDHDEHLRSRLRELEEQAEARLRELEQRTERLRRREARALESEEPAVVSRLVRENARLEERLGREREEAFGGRALVCGAFGVWAASLAGLGLWFALDNAGLALFAVVLGGLCGAGFGYFFDP